MSVMKLGLENVDTPFEIQFSEQFFNEHPPPGNAIFIEGFIQINRNLSLEDFEISRTATNSIEGLGHYLVMLRFVDIFR